jgi:2'-5' RNA ligase
VRCFVAADVPEEVRAAIARAAAAVRRAARKADVRWVDPAALHLTLKFLGEVAESRLSDLARALAAGVAGRAPFEVAARGLGGFPSVRQPRVVWAGIVVGVAELAELAAAIERALGPLGFPSEARPFRGHVTIGRVRSPRGRERLANAVTTAAALELGAWKVREAVLYRSHLRPGGAVYEALARLPLK